jgi:virulence-associated protein VapD
MNNFKRYKAIEKVLNKLGFEAMEGSDTIGGGIETIFRNGNTDIKIEIINHNDNLN